jgi:hypothetical protein
MDDGPPTPVLFEEVDKAAMEVVSTAEDEEAKTEETGTYCQTENAATINAKCQTDKSGPLQGGLISIQRCESLSLRGHFHRLFSLHRFCLTSSMHKSTQTHPTKHNWPRKFRKS